jgi:enediyne biosynthesis protein E4
VNARTALVSCCLVLLALIRVSSTAEPENDCLIRLHDVTATSNVTFQHTHGGSGERYIMETVAAGLALFDYDADGFIDLYFLNGAALKGTVLDTPPKNALYRNNGDWTFTDVTQAAGVGDLGFGLGVTVGDYDSDGDPDLYINNSGPNVLYRNNGDGTFTDVTQQAGVDCGNQVGAGACFLDIDNDGDLDLYAANYVVFSYETHVPITVDGYRWHVGPRAYPAATDNLFRNNGDGTFTDITNASGIGSVAGTGMGIVAGDFDDDGDSDVFVCNDIKGNFLFQNDGKGKFEEIGLIAGVAYDLYGRENASMGVDCGDFDNDGRLDLFMTDYQGEPPILYRNLGDCFFEDVTLVAGVGKGAFPHVNWGTGMVDFDNDGDRDLFIACGHTDDNADYRDDSTKYRVANIVLMNTGDGRFVNVSSQCGSGLDPIESSRGAGFDDLDNDGDIDVVILNSQAGPTILRNESASSNHWVDIHLRGAKANRDAVGARVTVIAGNLTQIAEVHGGRGYQGYHGSRLHFGLGARDRIDRVEVRWPGSDTEIFDGIEIDKIATLAQGTSDHGPANQ